MDFFVKSIKVKDSFLFSKSEYLFGEQSFTSHEPTDVSLMINQQYIALDVSLKGNLITGVSGYFNIANCSEKSLAPMEGENGKVEVVSLGFPLESGVGYSYPIVGEAFFDTRKSLLQIGEITQTEENIKIAENIILGISEEQVMCIQIKIE